MKRRILSLCIALVFVLALLPATARAVNVNTWSGLQTALNNGGNIKLTGNVTAGANDAVLEIPEDVEVILDLNGLTLDRNLASAQADGGVLYVVGELTVRDSVGGGVITGGKTTGNGGGICVEGVFTLEGGTISGNTASGDGGGVFADYGSEIHLIGGTVTGNDASGEGGGVLVDIYADAYISGSPVVTDNTSNGIASNVYLDSASGRQAKLNVTGALMSDARLGIRIGRTLAEGERVKLTSGLSANGGTNGLAAFVSDERDYTIDENSAGEAILRANTMTWADLQAALNEGGTVMLTSNVTAGADDTYLNVPRNVTVTLDLNGYTIDRNLDEAVENGSVLHVVGNLTLEDNSTTGTGMITGGNTTGEGGGVFIERLNGFFTMNGGNITGNTANLGGGVYYGGLSLPLPVHGSPFTMNGGNITENTANIGGGVHMSGGSLTMNGGNIIGNIAGYGGGICIYDDFKNENNIEGGSITGNTAYTSGGGIYIESGLIIMTGGSITGNAAYTSGGGVYIESGSITMTGGSITGNNGGGVNISSDGEYTISGKPVITDNVVGGTITDGVLSGGTACNVYLAEGKTITLDGALKSGAAIGVTVQTPPAEGESLTFTDGLTSRGRISAFSSDDPNYTIVWNDAGDEAAITKSVFKTQSLVLSGQLGLNFFLDLSMLTEQEKAGTTVVFQIGNRTETEEAAFDADFTNSAGSYYGFTCHVNAIQMADTITATCHYTKDGEAKTVQKTYSVKEYLAYFDENIGQFDDKTIALAHAVADYGHYVQIYLSQVNGWTIGEDYAEMDTFYSAFTDEDYTGIAEAIDNTGLVCDKSGLNENVEKVTYTLDLKSKTEMFIYIQPANGCAVEAQVDFNGHSYTAEPIGNRYRIVIPGISAHLLDEMMTIDGKAGGEEFSVELCALSYVYAVLNSTSALFDNAAAKNAVASIYAYSAAAEAY